VDPACHGAPTFEVLERTWSARLDGETIDLDSGTEKSVETGSCGYPELGGSEDYGSPPEGEE
jgi:hypothetical protein